MQNFPKRAQSDPKTQKTIIEGFIDSIILVAKRLAQSVTIGHDEVICKIFDWKDGMASQSTCNRFFKRSILENNEEIMRRSNRRWSDMVDIERHRLKPRI